MLDPTIFDKLVKGIYIIIKVVITFLLSIIDIIYDSFKWFFGFQRPDTYFGEVMYLFVAIIYTTIILVASYCLILKCINLFKKGVDFFGKDKSRN